MEALLAHQQKGERKGIALLNTGKGKGVEATKKRRELLAESIPALGHFKTAATYKAHLDSSGGSAAPAFSQPKVRQRGEQSGAWLTVCGPGRWANVTLSYETRNGLSSGRGPCRTSSGQAARPRHPVQR